MFMRVHYIHEKGSRLVNEDELLITADRFAVFDGVSSLEGRLIAGITGGKSAALIAKEEFAKQVSLMTAAFKANRRILAAMENKGVNIFSKEERWATTVAAVCLRTGEFLTVGDSLILAIRIDGYDLVTPYVDHDMNTLCMMREFANVPDVRQLYIY